MSQGTSSEPIIVDDNDILNKTDVSAIGNGLLSEFHFFPKLPLEMRLMIWKKTFPAARAVLLQLEREPKDEKGPEIFKLVSPCSIPVALKVCQESRTEAKRRYELGLANQFHEGRIYIDFEYDIVYMAWRGLRTGSEVDISPKLLSALLSKDEADKIQRMAVSSIYSEHPYELFHFQSFGGLKELSVEFETREMPDRRDVTLIEEEEFKFQHGHPSFDDMGVLDRDFVLEIFHEVRKAFPGWKAPDLRFVRSATDVVSED